MNASCSLSLLCISLALYIPRVWPAVSSKQQSGTARANTTISTTRLNINNISTIFSADGWADRNRSTGNSGFTFPKGSGKTAIFESGVLFGGKLNGQLRMSGSTYSGGMQPGRILASGVLEDPNLPKNRVYRVRPDYRTADLSTEVTEEGGTANEIRLQYERDWIEWPTNEGAPYDDINNNGSYEPGVDRPGMKGAGQTLWFVCNDAVSMSWFGTPPMRIEMQTTIWAYKREGALANVLFKKYLLINKSNNRYDSMYVSQWVDADVGDAGDDLAGCDTSLSVGYTYNGNVFDYIYRPFVPPAVGLQILTSPINRSGGSGHVQAQRIPMTAFAIFPNVEDPPWSRDDYARLYYFFFQGKDFLGYPVLNPITNQQTTFQYSGNPVDVTGWIDPLPRDRRFFASSGPFTMAAGDSQEIVIASMASIGTTNVSGITNIRSLARIAQTMQQNLFQLLPPNVSIAVTYPNNTSSMLKFTADAKGLNTSAASIFLRRNDSSPITTVQLFDDGSHGDSAANDQLFGSLVTINREPASISVSARITYNQNQLVDWEKLYETVTVAGDIEVINPILLSDNLNSDGRVNAGENIRFGLSVRNATPFLLSEMKVFSVMEQEGKSRSIGALSSGATDSMQYHANDLTTYFSLNVPAPFTDSRLTIPVTVVDSRGNGWNKSVSFAVHQLPAPVETLLVQNAGDSTKGSFEIIAANLSAIKPHLYIIRGVGRINDEGDVGITIYDSTDGRMLLRNHPLPDELAHTMPLTDGFKVRKGTLELHAGVKEVSVPHGQLRWSYANGNELGLGGFGGAIGNYAYSFPPFLDLPAMRHHAVLIKLAATNITGDLLDANDTTASIGYRYVRNSSRTIARPEFAPFITNRTSSYAFQDFQRKIPFAAYDVTVVPSRRLAVGFTENNVTAGMVDGMYWPPTDTQTPQNSQSNGPQEFFFIFDAPYSEISDPNFTVDLRSGEFPVMWRGVPARAGNTAFVAGDEFKIIPKELLTPSDVWTFAPALGQIIPSEFALAQNYPNPFNPSTTIIYDLPVDSRVRVAIYDLLGREVKTLVDENQSARYKTVQWDGTNSTGNHVATGVYFYRVDAASLATPAARFVQTKKMLLIR